MLERTYQLPMLNFRAAMVPETIDLDKRTVEVVWTTGARGKRCGVFQREYYARDYYEELAIEPENIKLDRFIGAPVLDQHQHVSVRNILGVVDSAHPVKSSNGKTREWRAFARFCDDADDVFQKVAGGFIRFVSVGYLVNRYVELEERGQDDIPILRAVDWEPGELSFVTVPFDAKASVRSHEMQSNCTIIPFNRSNVMPDPVESVIAEPVAEPAVPVQERQTVIASPPAPEPPPVDAKAIRQAAIADVNAVREAAMVVGFADASGFERMLIENKTLDEVRAAIIAEAARKQPKIDTTSSRISAGTNLAVEGVERGIGEAMLARALPGEYTSKVTDAGRRFQRDSVFRMAERLLEAHGVNTDGLSKQRVIEKACIFRSGSHSTSDFHHLFISAADRILQDESNRVRLTYLPLATNVELPDFRDSNYVIVGDNFTLKEQAENEEVTYGTFTADGRSFRLGTFSRGIIWSRRMMINDDLGVLARLPAMVNRAGDKIRSKMVWSMIIGDGVNISPNGIIMGDSTPLFASIHGNLAAEGGPINKATISEARKAIRRQKAFGGKDEDDTLDLEPKYLVVGPEKEQEANDFLAANYTAVNQEAAAALNLSRSLSLIVEHRITDASWYLVSTDIDGIVTATLQGQQGMYLDTDSDFDTDGFKLKGRLDFGVHMARWEGWYKNPGA